MKRYLLILATVMYGASGTIMAVNETTVERLRQDDPHGFGITILCMGVVFLCLALLFAFFKAFGYFADRQAKLKEFAEMQPVKPIVQTGKMLNEVRQVTSNILQDGIDTKGRDKKIYIAVIAMAMKQYLDDMHDVESGVLTIKPHASAWNILQLNEQGN